MVPVDEKKVSVEILSETTIGPTTLLLRIGERIVRVAVTRQSDQTAYSVEINDKPLVVRLEEETLASRGGSAEVVEGPVVVTSPMAGKIAAVKISPGTAVDEGQALIVLEAMKMENEIAAPKKGTVKEVYVQQGALAKPGDRLVLVE